MPTPDHSRTPVSNSSGLLNVEVKAPPLIAGKMAIISLVIRNPFLEPITIEGLETPDSSFFAPRNRQAAEKAAPSNGLGVPPRVTEKSDSYWNRLKDFLSQEIQIKQVSIAGVVAQFPGKPGRTIEIHMEKNSKCTVTGPLDNTDDIFVYNAEGAEVAIDTREEKTSTGEASTERIIHPGQEDVTTLEIRTTSWLFSKPTTLDLYALLRYRINENKRSQVIPIKLPIQPPVRSVVIGCMMGGILGFLARQINSGAIVDASISLWAHIIHLLGITIMSIIVAIVLSRRETSQGFITLEDFYGAFVIGVLTGYIGTEYFDELIATANVGG